MPVTLNSAKQVISTAFLAAAILAQSFSVQAQEESTSAAAGAEAAKIANDSGGIGFGTTAVMTGVVAGGLIAALLEAGTDDGFRDGGTSTSPSTDTTITTTTSTSTTTTTTTSTTATSSN